MDWQTFGHEHVKNILQKQLENNQLAHAYLFVGPEGLGKKLLALDMAKSVLAADTLDNHPDFIFFANSGGEIPVEQSRRMVGELSTKPFIGKRKVVVFDEAHKLNASSGNALLKALEEPSSSSVIFLVASSKPLATIVSRCQVFRFNPFSKKKLAEYAASRGVSPDEDVLDLSFGSPARLSRLCGDGAYVLQEQQRQKDLRRISGLSKGERLTKISELAGLEPADLENILSAWLMDSAGRLKLDLGLARAVAALQAALGDLKTNKNKKLILQSLFSKI